jgi:hypothetical protein
MPLPNKIIPLPNPDKVFHESWSPGRNLLNIPHPFRAVFLGPPNSGKSTVVKNILMRADPPFKAVVIVHCDSLYTQEYKDVDNCIMLDRIPAPEEWPGDRKMLVILEDLEFKGMDKKQKQSLDRLFGYVSTHKNISVCLCAQDAFNVPPCVRRCSNLFVLWRCPDMDSANLVARKAGLTAKKLNGLFDQHCPGPKDSVWIDLSDHTPAKIRINGFTTIK